MIAFHGLKDMGAAGDDGDQQVKIAEGLLDEVGTYCVFHMKRKAAEALASVAHLSPEDVDVISKLRRHEYLLFVGTDVERRRFKVRHIITDDERAIVKTEHR